MRRPRNIAAVLESEPNVAALPPDTPASIRGLLRRCLQKDPRQRLREMGDARIEIAEALGRPARTRAVNAAQSAQSRRGRVMAYTVAASVITGTLGWVVTRSTPSPPASVVRFIVTPPTGLSPVSPQNAIQNVAISADGTRLAYRSMDAAIVRSLDEVVLMPLRPIGLGNPFFLSADGSWLGWVDTNGLQKMPVAGGPAVVVASATLSAPGYLAGGASWGRDEVIVFADDNGLWRVSAGGGVPERLLASAWNEPENVRPGPSCCRAGNPSCFDHHGWHGRGGRPTRGPRCQHRHPEDPRQRSQPGRYVPTGHLLYASRGVIFAVAFDLERLEARGDTRRHGDRCLGQ